MGWGGLEGVPAWGICERSVGEGIVDVCEKLHWILLLSYAMLHDETMQVACSIEWRSEDDLAP